MERIYDVQIGLVINNQDPENRGRVQVFIPHLSNTIYKDWNENTKDKNFKTLDSSIFKEDILQKLIDVLPWAEMAMPFFGGGTGAPVSQGREVTPIPTGVETKNNSTPPSAIVGGLGVPGTFTGLNNTSGKEEPPKQSKYKNVSFSKTGYESLDGVSLDSKMTNFLTELDSLNLPIVVTEGVRAKNANYGVKNSNHKVGRAVDIRANLTDDDLKKIIKIGVKKHGMNEIGTYLEKTKDGEKRWIHLGYDSRSNVTVFRDDLKIANSAINEPLNKNDKIEGDDNNPSSETKNIVRPKNDTFVETGIAESSGSAMGQFSIPQVGSKAYVMFLDGHILKPIVIGCYMEPSNVKASGVIYPNKPNNPLGESAGAI
jgi:hypothetical protein